MPSKEGEWGTGNVAAKFTVEEEWVSLCSRALSSIELSKN
jgi:hypothetical protein